MGKTFWCAGLIACVLMPLCSGCDSSRDADLGRVRGRVTLDGKPLSKAMVTVSPAQGRPSQGVTDAEGRYVLKYTSQAEGVLIGTHPIRLELPVPEPEGAERMSPEAYQQAMAQAARQSPIPPNWRSGKERITVETGTQEFNIELTSSN